MTTAYRAVQQDQRAGSRASNFHAPAALDSYGRHFNRIGIASVAAAAAQIRPGSEPAPSTRSETPVPAIFREDDDAA
jgi:hypothetical protein